MICPNCNFMNPDNLSNCKQCGYPLNANIRPAHPVSQQPMYQNAGFISCPNCKSMLPSGSIACNYCGFSLNTFSANHYTQQLNRQNMNSDPRMNMPPQPQGQMYNNTQRYNVPNSNQPTSSNKRSDNSGCLVGIILLIFLGVWVRNIIHNSNGNDASSETRSPDTSNSVTIEFQDEQAASEEKATEKAIEYNETIPLDVIYEDDNFIIKTTQYSHDSLGVNIGLYIENKTSTPITYAISDIAINNQMLSSWLHGDITAGNKANDTLSISSSELSKLIETDIRSYTLRFAVWNSDDFSDYVVEPIEIQTSLYKDVEKYTEGKTVFSDENLDISYIGNDSSTYKFVIRNKSNDFIMWGIEGITINGFSNSDLNYLISGTTFSKKEGYFEMDISSEFKNNNDIQEIETIEFNLTGHFGMKYYNDYDTGVISVDLK